MKEDWQTITLGDFVEFQRGFDLPIQNRVRGDYPLITSNGQDGTQSVYKVRGPGIVIGRSGTLGKVHYVEKDFWPLNTTLWVKDFHGNDVKFVYYFLQTLSLEKYNSGSGVPTLNRNHIHPLKVRIPELSVQREIAAILSALDNKIELLRAQNKTLEDIAQRLFKEWFVDFNFPNADGKPYKKSGGKMVQSELGEIPEGWTVKSYSDLVRVLSGGTPKTDKPEYWNGQIPFFTPKDARDTFYVDVTEKYITEAGLNACNSKLYPKDTVFITARGTVGKCALALRDMAMNQSCYALVGKDISNLFVFLLTKQLIETIKKSASGAVFDAITFSTFHSLNVALGDREVTDRFETLIRPMFNKIANNTNEVHNLSELRDQLLPKLMNGEIQMRKG